MIIATRKQRIELSNYIKGVCNRNNELDIQIEKIRLELYMSAIDFKCRQKPPTVEGRD